MDGLKVGDVLYCASSTLAKVAVTSVYPGCATVSIEGCKEMSAKTVDGHIKVTTPYFEIDAYNTLNEAYMVKLEKIKADHEKAKRDYKKELGLLMESVRKLEAEC